jgi:colanic acid biosynthesis protein WcaH
MSDTSIGLADLIRRVEGYIETPAQTLPEEVFLFMSRISPLVNVDLLIQDNCGRTLLTWRSDRFFGPGWHVPGGIIRHKEAAAERIRAVARLELGVSITFEPAPILVHESIRPDWRDRAHAISLLYKCRLASDLNEQLQFTPEAPLPAQWQWHERCPENLIPEQRAYSALIG